MARSGSRWFSVLIGTVLIFFGGVLLLDRLGIETETFWRYWPVVLNALGVGVIFSKR